MYYVDYTDSVVNKIFSSIPFMKLEENFTFNDWLIETYPELDGRIWSVGQVVNGFIFKDEQEFLAFCLKYC